VSKRDKILSRAIKSLGKKDYSKRELKESLEKKFCKEEIEEAIKFLERKGLIDDKKLAQKIIDKYMERGKGYYYIERELKRRKIEEKVINEMMENFDFEKEFQNGEKYILKNMGKRDISSIFLTLKSRGYSEKTMERVGERYGKQ